MSSLFPLLERQDSEERCSALQEDQLHILSDRCMADASWGKREKNLKVEFHLSGRMQFKSCFTGDAEGRTSCIIFSKTCDAWVLVQHSRWWIICGGETESCILHRAIRCFTLLIFCCPSYSFLVYFYRNACRKEVESGSMFVETLKGSLKCLKFIFWLFQKTNFSEKDNMSSTWLVPLLDFIV